MKGEIKQFIFHQIIFFYHYEIIMTSQSQQITISQTKQQIKVLKQQIKILEKKWDDTLDEDRLYVEFNRLNTLDTPFTINEFDDLLGSNVLQWFRRKARREELGLLDDHNVSFVGAFHALKWFREERRKQKKLEDKLFPLYDKLEQAKKVKRWLKFKQDEIEEDQEVLAWRFYVQELAREAKHEVL